jgi:hypothetical protein
MGDLSLRVKWPGHEDDYSPPSRVHVKNMWSYICIPDERLHSMPRDNVTLFYGKHLITAGFSTATSCSHVPKK